MKIKIVILSVLMLHCSFLFSQQFNNEWINYDQQYFRIAVHTDGVYKISYNQLISAGIPVDQIDPRNIQLFHEGEEQYIYIKGEGTSGIFDPSGYIEFYGKRNRAGIDSMAYTFSEDIVNHDYSYFNDTASYFLTWNNTTNNRRMIVEDDTDFTQYTSNLIPYLWCIIRQNYVSTFVKGSIRCIFGDGEGWFDNEILRKDHPDGDATVNKSLTVPYIYASGPSATLETAVSGFAASAPENFFPHHLIVKLNDSPVIETQFLGYDYAVGTASIALSSLSTGLNLNFSANDVTLTSVPDQMVVSYIQLTYPRTLNAGNQSYFEFTVPAGSGGKQLLQLNNFISTDGNDVVFYDLDSHRRIKVVKQGTVHKALIPENGSERRCIMCGDNSLKQVDGIYKVSDNNKFINYHALYPQATYLIITHKSLMGSAQQYAAYRSGRGENVLIADVDQLYNQFAYGVQKHPIGIRNFVFYLVNNNTVQPEYLFLFGKSVHCPDTRNDPNAYAYCLVPSMGYPSSDNLFTAPFDGTGYEPLLATGRICARTNEEALIYLNKVIQYENNEPAEWMKNVLHFGGGANESEQTYFAGFLRNYEAIIEDSLFGGYVSTFLKNSSAPVQITQSDSVRNLINNGVSLMTFFGHASANGFDQSIDDPANYENQGKYPFVLANSCYAGDIHLYSNTCTSEEWVLIQDKGAIAFLASVGEGLPSYLNFYSTELYNKVSRDYYGSPIGLQLIKAIQAAEVVFLTNVRMEITCHEFTLHGDPIIAINAFELPDLTVKNSDIAFLPNEINTTIDSFDVQIVVSNIGRTTSSGFTVNVNRTYPDGTMTEYVLGVDGCLYRDTINIRLPVNKIIGPGLNKLDVFTDAMNTVEEFNENNNLTSISFLIRSSDLFPVFPYEFAIIPEDHVRLIASTGDPFLGDAQYIFQIDTSDTFNSLVGLPLLQQTLSSSGGLLYWDVPMVLNDSTVYYWRIARNHTITDSIIWKESSFIYIPHKEGWSQAHFFQFKNDRYQFIDYNRVNRAFDFVTVPRSLMVYNQRYVSPQTYSDVRFTIDGGLNNGLGDHGCCGNQPAVIVAVIDPVTLLAYQSDYSNYGHRNYPQCGSSGRVNYYFIFSSGWGTEYYSEGIQNMNNMILSIPNGHYVLFYSWTNAYFEQWEENVLSNFEALGSTQIRDLTNDQAYIFFCRKGSPSSAKESYSTAQNPYCTLQADLFTDFNYGYILSKTIGPASAWTSFEWLQHSLESPSYDTAIVCIEGIRSDGTVDILIDSIKPDNYLIPDISNTIAATEYPYLQMKFYSRDDLDKTPAQLDKWQLYFDEAPETAINVRDGYHFCCDTINEGDEIVFAIATRNVSTVDMDSLLVKFWLQDKNNQIIPIATRRLRPHPAGDIIIDTIRLETHGMSGLNSVWVEYNPINDLLGYYDQIEQHHFNNIAQKYFYVLSDEANPLLDVSFDGIHIMDGDIVSATPEILITLKDENKYLALNDTSLFRVYLTDNENGTETRIFFNAVSSWYNMEWVPAQLPDNSCKIIFRPVFNSDGTYQLRVQATDISGNESGDFDYLISFKIVTESAITNLLNYPNPFSTSTRFVFELTGSEIPDDFTIEIFTVTGKLVKVIDLFELGGVHIGRNITTYAWDGTDMFGDRLANGVYFYRVKARINGNSVDHRQSAADNYFKNDTGKMYILR
ncbi:MAG: hypothetical protein KBB11_03005 [Bacteroidales bacterium]|nr:hypothetical protein [Bacteroidales bacterium]